MSQLQRNIALGGYGIALLCVGYYLIVTAQWKLMVKMKEKEVNKLRDDLIPTVQPRPMSFEEKLAAIDQAQKEVDEDKKKMEDISVTWGLWMGLGMFVGVLGYQLLY
jgi:hypothetical protein